MHKEQKEAYYKGRVRVVNITVYSNMEYVCLHIYLRWYIIAISITLQKRCLSSLSVSIVSVAVRLPPSSISIDLSNPVSSLWHRFVFDTAKINVKVNYFQSIKLSYEIKPIEL